MDQENKSPKEIEKILENTLPKLTPNSIKIVYAWAKHVVTFDKDSPYRIPQHVFLLLCENFQYDGNTVEQFFTEFEKAPAKQRYGIMERLEFMANYIIGRRTPGVT